MDLNLNDIMGEMAKIVGGVWLTDEEQLRVELELPNLSALNNENE